MSFYYAYTCDICGTKDEAWPVSGYLSVRAPEGWRSIDGRHVCSYPCLARYAADPDGFRAQKLDPDPVGVAMEKSFRKGTAKADRKTRTI